MELIFNPDKSGSMFGLESGIIGGYNAMLSRQKKRNGRGAGDYSAV